MKKIYCNRSVKAISYVKTYLYANGKRKDYYDYLSTDGYLYRLSTQDDGISQEDINMLYKLDNENAEWYRRRDKLKISRETREQMQKYDETHYSKEVGNEFCFALEALYDFAGIDELDKSKVMLDAWNTAHPEEADRIEILRRLLKKLKPEEQLLIHLVFFEEYSYTMAGEYFGVSKVAIKHRLDAIFKKLRESIMKAE